MSPTRPRTAAGGVALLIALTGTAYAVGTTMSPKASADVMLPAFDDCAALQQRMADLAMPYVTAYGLGQAGGYAVPAIGTGELSADMVLPQSAAGAPVPLPADSAGAAAAAPPMAPGAPAAGQSSDTYRSESKSAHADAADAVGPGATGTNLQEAGVDEPDVAKTDGRHVYSLTGGTLRITDVGGDSPRVRGSYDLAGRGIAPTELLLAGDRVLVLGTSSTSPNRGYPEGDARVDGYGSYGYGTAVLALLDVSDRDNPVLISTEEITGRQVSARMTGRSARIVLTSSPELSFRRPSGYAAGEDSALAYNKDVVRYAKAADWLPSRTVVDGSGRISSPAAPLVACSDVRYPAEDSGLDMLSVLTLDLGRDDALSTATSTAVVTAGELVYASPERLYVATTQGGWGRMNRVDVRGGGDTLTSVHEFDISDPARTVYRSSGAVGGYIPGRWAMSEYEGNLRVVTTTRQPWLYDGSTNSGESVSNIVVLRPRKDHLVQVGGVSGMGRGETVRSVRWFDELAAVVTFRQTDPLYLVDMSVPESPRVRGALKVPGFSEYLHPVGDHRLLGVGQDATEQGWQQGLQVSSFDIGDADDPRQTDKVTYGQGSSSPVETDPRGFVYLPDTRTAVLPAQYPSTQLYPPTPYPVDDSAGGAPMPAPPCPPDAKCAFAQPMYPRISQGLVSVRIGRDGQLTKVGAWGNGSRDASGGFADGGAVTKVLSLPGGRLAALTDSGLTVLDSADLTARGSTRFF